MKQAKKITKLPILVKLLLGMLAGLLMWRVMSIVAYSRALPEGQSIMPTPTVLFDLAIPFSLDQQSGIVATLVTILTPMGISVYEDSIKKTRRGEEQGSAIWTDSSYTYKFRDKDYFNNQIMTKTELYSRNMRVSKRSRNILLLGRPGTGKSRYYFKPNLLQRENGTIVVTDPKGELLRDCGYALKQNGYTIKVLNLDEMWQSNHYNPFAYLKFINTKTQEVCVNLTDAQSKSGEYKLIDADVLQIIQSIMKNTDGDSKGGASQDPFWPKAEQLYLSSIIYYICYNYPKRLQNFDSVLDLMRKSEAPEGEKSILDIMFEEWELGKVVTNDQGEVQYNYQIDKPASKSMFGGYTPPTFNKDAPTWISQQPENEQSNYVVDSEGVVRMLRWVNEFGIPKEAVGDSNIGIKQYKHMKSGVKSEKTMATIMLSAAARLAPMNIPEVSEFLRDDDMELERLGQEEPTLALPGTQSTGGRIAWFIVTKPSDNTFNFIANLFYTQTFQMIDLVAKQHQGSCPSPVDLYMDEWAQLGEIPRFVETLAYIRGLNAGVTIGLQSLDQLKERYEKSWERVLDCCDYILYLGSASKTTLEYITAMLGKETITKRSNSRSYGKSGSSSHSDDSLGRDLLDMQELRSIGEGHCVLIDNKNTDGSAFFSDLYNLEDHPRYSELYEPWAKNDPENRKKEYRHSEELKKHKEALRFERFYSQLQIDPKAIRMRLESVLVDGNKVQPQSGMMSADEFLARHKRHIAN